MNVFLQTLTTPSLCLAVELSSDIAYSSPRSAVLLDLLKFALKDSMVEEHYPAELAGLYFLLNLSVVERVCFKCVCVCM